jgi:hypothetical protein
MKIVSQTKRKKTGKPGYTRVYFFPSDETVLENMQNRHDRPYETYRSLLPLVLMAEGVPGDVSRDAVWSQRAGCSCGCSPGFIIKRRGITSDYDVFVNVSS